MGLLNLRNALMAGKKSPLPPGARWVEYLESAGRQYINTGVVPTSQTKWMLDAMFSAEELSSYMAMGALWTEPTRRFVIGRESNNRVSVSYGTFDNNINIAGQGIRQTYVLDAPNFTWKVGSASGAFSSGTFDIIGIGEIFIFARNRVGVVNAITKGFRVYQSSIYDTGRLVRDFRPIAIGTTGYMLDLVSGEYLPYGNKGTGDFVIGPDVVPVNFVDGEAYNSSGAIITAQGFSRIDDYLPVIGGHSVTFNYGGAANSNCALIVYDSGKTRIDYWSAAYNNERTITMNANGAFVRFAVYEESKQTAFLRDNTTGEYIMINGKRIV